ncbi:hypothetical protein [Nitrosospira sp. NRS527]|uniref:hypothetical protein n=1 Tax=Nitrosospira sp. NRS527 TaxID=155925 RepID=UPI001AF1D503|nr:hypothetical protein [Nitrosospira sp. NRS527]BCT68592.1 hypothetical protein NNRS527_02195 [Nitrosospira sp. NRS527]
MRISSTVSFHSALMMMAYATSVFGALSTAYDETLEAETKARDNSLIVSCSPETPLVSLGQSVRLKVWVTTSNGKLSPAKLTYEWSVNGGHIRGQTAAVQWDLKNAKPGNYVANVRVTAPGVSVAECALQIFVESIELNSDIHTNDERGMRESGRSFLLPKQPEHKGYGLISYFLLGGPPSETTRERYLKAIEAYLLLLPDIARLERYFAPSELNITYLPVDGPPPAITDIKLLARWVLEHYDYPRSRHLMRHLPGDNRDGPYIISASSAVSTGVPFSNYLLQNLSAVPPSLAESWVKEFMNQAAQEHFWEARSLPQLRLKIRTTIAVLAMALPAVLNSLDSYIKRDKLSLRDSEN